MEKNSSNNTIGSILRVIAWITYVGGFIAGLVLGNVEVPYIYISGTHTEFSFTVALIYWVSAFISGTIFLGFAEIISLLQKLVDIGKTNIAKTSSNEIGSNPEQYKDLPKL